MYHDVQNGGVSRGGIFGAARRSIQMGPAVVSMMTFRTEAWEGKGAASRWSQARSYQGFKPWFYVCMYIGVRVLNPADLSRGSGKDSEL